MQTEPEQGRTNEVCTDDCCQDPPGFGKAYAIGIGALFGVILLASLISGLLR